MYVFTQPLHHKQETFCGAVANALDCNIIVSKFKLQIAL